MLGEALNFIKAGSPVRPQSPVVTTGGEHVIAREDQFDFLSAEYRELFEKSHVTAFQSPSWLHLFYEQLIPYTSNKPVIITVRCAMSRRLQMLLPLTWCQSMGLITIESADCFVCDYFAAVALPELRKSIANDGAIGATLRSLMQPFDIIMLKKMRTKDAWIGDLIGDNMSEEMDIGSHEVKLFDDHDEWKKKVFSKGFRKNLSRRGRALQAMGHVECRKITGTAELTEVLDTLRHYRTSRFADDILTDESIFEFYKAVALDGISSGNACTYGLFLDDQLVAAEFSLVHNGRLIIILGGADYDAFEKIGPGSQMLDHLLQSAVESGIRKADFSVGDEPYKKDFGATRLPLYRTNYGQSLTGQFARALFKPAKAFRDGAGKLVKNQLSSLALRARAE